MKDTNPVLRSLASLRSAIDESENPVVASVRGAAYGVSSWLFDETETARVTGMMRNMDPFFEREAFERELREYIVPEVVDAYLSADREALKKWCGEAVSCLCCWFNLRCVKQGLDIQRIMGYYGAIPQTRLNQR